MSEILEESSRLSVRLGAGGGLYYFFHSQLPSTGKIKYQYIQNNIASLEYHSKQKIFPLTINTLMHWCIDTLIKNRLVHPNIAALMHWCNNELVHY